jgi:hypothetical protein
LRTSSSSERRAWTRFVETGSTEAVVNKFHAEKTDVNGRTFDSGREANRAIELQWLEQIGDVTDLQYQVSYELVPKQGKEKPAYRADFVYFDKKLGRLVVEDAKGKKTSTYILKRKLMLWVHNIVIYET